MEKNYIDQLPLGKKIKRRINKILLPFYIHRVSTRGESSKGIRVREKRKKIGKKLRNDQKEKKKKVERKIGRSFSQNVTL